MDLIPGFRFLAIRKNQWLDIPADRIELTEVAFQLKRIADMMEKGYTEETTVKVDIDDGQ